MKKIIIAALVATLLGCTSASPKQYYRPAGAEQQVEVYGRFDQISFEHQVLINGNVVIDGQLSYNYDDGHFSGQYDGMTVTSDCKWKLKKDLICLVKINDEMAATLTF
ncbi:hypothetical protein [Methylophaga sulfidovorans]|uniref:Lipoprotein n=1 Tax=Methylophaga sulfidovorans TaxID=45496 RepID=A0A1I4A3C1_9GAMM|nr:hypothetical protein [Methylophaga sulfidovorans]SFK50750.1 hypothetical protein SAMN04488079_11316 [Methylophaga sulfidovorans]